MESEPERSRIATQRGAPRWRNGFQLPVQESMHRSFVCQSIHESRNDGKPGAGVNPRNLVNEPGLSESHHRKGADAPRDHQEAGHDICSEQ